MKGSPVRRLAALLSVMLLCLAACARSGLSGVAVSPTEEHVRLIGRTYVDDGVTWLPLSGSAVEFLATGTRVQIELEGDDSVSNEESLRPRFAVLVNGEVVVDDTLDRRTRTVDVALGGSDAQAIVEVIHLSEADRGLIGVREIRVDTTESAPIAPTEAKGLSIEFIGDSITCGFGVETANADEPFATTTENFMKTYAYLTAQALDADYSAVCYSGYGIVSGWTANQTLNEGMLIPPVYGLVVGGCEQQWDFSAHAYDVVVINLGTNDFTYTGTDEARMQEFAFGYADFLARVRACNPDALIVCTIGTMGCEELYPYVEQAVDAYRGDTGDARVVCYLSDAIDMEVDGCGTNGHPNAITQQKSAEKLAEVIRQELGLEG